MPALQRSFKIFIVIGIFLILAVSSVTNAQSREGNELSYLTGHYIKNQVYIHWNPEIVTNKDEDKDLKSISELQETASIKKIEQSGQNFIRERETINLSGNESIPEAIVRLKQNPGVLSVQPVFLKSLDVIPNDPLFNQQWSLDNKGQFSNDLFGSLGSDIDAERAWNITAGSKNVIVAVIDTGVDYNHPDLVENMWKNTGEIPDNGIDDDGNGYIDDYRGWNFIDNDNDPMDSHGHGTAIAGILGAKGNNNIGIAGTAWNITIMPLKVVGFFNDDYEVYGPAEYEAISYAKKMGASIIVCSWGIGDFDEEEFEEISDFPDAIFVCSAGNEGINNDITPHYPSGYDSSNIISVAASDENDDLAYFSNYGYSTVDLAAPGIEIYTTAPGGKYIIKDGTSFSTPIVAGAAALLKSIDSTLTPVLIRKLLIDSSDKKFSLSGKILSNGRLNIFGAILAVESRLQGELVVNSTPSQGEVYINGELSGKTPYFGQKIKQGEYNIEVVKQGYESWIQNVTIKPQELTNINATLIKEKISGNTGQYGKIKVSSNQNAAGVFLDSVYRGATDLSILQVKTGRHQLIVRKEGYTTYKSNFTIEKGKTVYIVANLSKNK